MTLPHGVARFNRRVTNRVLGPIVMRLPGFGMLVHSGRNSGRRYRTPIMAFRSGDRFVIALTYGPGTDWVRNIEASGWCLLETRSGTFRLGQPRVFHDERRRSVPRLVRPPLRLLGISDFMELWLVDELAD